MDKLLTYPGKTEKGIFTFSIDAEKNFLEKTAAEYNPTIAAYIHDAKHIKGVTQILLTALGAGEWWGNNVNGDYFREVMLAHDGPEYGFRTFEHMAKVYKHHLNKPHLGHPNYGDVLLSTYNSSYHRVELIVGIRNADAPDIEEQMAHGNYPEWSMGCRVPFDVCNHCGNKAPTVKHYCEHAKYYLNKIYPASGKLVWVDNMYPKFHDISKVLIGADRTSKTLMKVAGGKIWAYTGSAVAAEKAAASKAAANKNATIDKRVPTDAPPASQDAIDALVNPISHVKAMEPVLPRQTIDRIAQQPLNSIFNTMSVLGILPKPQEFQRIILIKLGRRELADELDRKNQCFDPMMVSEPSPEHMKVLESHPKHFSQSLMDILKPHMPERSYAAPFLGKRITIMLKQANEHPLPEFIKVGSEAERKPVDLTKLLMAGAGLYAAFSKKAPGSALNNVEKLIHNHPGLAAALGISLVTTMGAMVGAGRKGQFSTGEYVNPDSGDIFARIERQKQKTHAKTAGVLSNVSAGAKRLYLGIPAVYMASNVLQKHRRANPYDEESRTKSFVRRNPDVIGLALVGDAIMSSRGKGTHGLMKSMAPAKSFFKKGLSHLKTAEETVPFSKTASAQEFLTSSLVWPIALGKANLPGRIVGSLFDQAVLEVGQRLVDRKRQQAEVNPYS